jgi:hypothetical protein
LTQIARVAIVATRDSLLDELGYFQWPARPGMPIRVIGRGMDDEDQWIELEIPDAEEAV